MDRPTRIYISSTFEDLKRHRAVLYDTLRTVDVDATDSMEHAVARNERTVDACLKDVEANDIYIGIFAFRYGYVPRLDNPGAKSITQMEYCHAVTCGKPCLIFLAEADGWPFALTDAHRHENGNGERIDSLRRHFDRGSRGRDRGVRILENGVSYNSGTDSGAFWRASSSALIILQPSPKSGGIR